MPNHHFLLLSLIATATACAAPMADFDRDDPGLSKNTASATQPNNGDNNPGPGGDTNKPPHKQAVAFIHGTSDHGNLADLKCEGAGAEWHCASATAVAEYWTQETIDSERTASDGTTKRPYVVIGCPLSAQTPWPNPTPVLPKGGAAEAGSAACVGAEVALFLAGPDAVAGTADDIDDIVLVTHSGGSNVVRYVLQQHSAKPEFDRVHGAARGFIGIAAPNDGTYLADRVFRFGTVLSVGNKLFGAGYNDDGVDFIQTTKMVAWNRDPAKLVSLDKDVAGVPAFMASGSFPDVDGDADKIACGGESETKGLNALHKLYLDADDPETFRDGCSDGFISCQSAMALTNGDESRVVFGMLGKKDIGKTRFRAHNQSRRSCDGLDLDIRRTINAILDKKPSSLRSGGHDGRGDDDALSLSPYRSLAAATAHFGSVSLESQSLVASSRGSLVRVRVHGVNEESASKAAFLRDPSGSISIPATFEHGIDGSTYAVARVPANASAGGWTMHVAGSRADIQEQKDARLPIWIAASSAGALRISSVTAERDDDGVNVRVVVSGRNAATTATAAAAAHRLGVHATLVTTESEAFVVSRGQASADVAGGGETTITVFLPASAEASNLSVRDVALVSHDDASTLDLRESVYLSSSSR